MIIHHSKKLVNFYAQQYPKFYVEIYCLSTDKKPIDTIANGSALTEVDTGDFYEFDGTSNSWVKQER